MKRKLNYSLKICRLTVHLIRGFFIGFFIFPLISKHSKRNHVQRWSRQLLLLFNVQINMNSCDVIPSSVIISNHVSWMDIFVINSLAPCRFVAKADIASWPLLGWLVKQGGTIFISRGNKADLRRIYQHLIEQIQAGERVAFFPEGATSTQGTLLPFHANLFEAAVHTKVPIQPLALRYLNSAGELHPAVDYAGNTTFVTSLMNVLRNDEIVIELNGLDCIATEGVHRRELANKSRKSIAMALGGCRT